MEAPRVFTLDELFQYREQLPPVLIERLLYSGTKLILGGQAKTGKSFLLHNLLHSLATGSPVFGCDQLPVPEPQPGILFSQELGDHALRGRWLKLLDLPRMELLRRNILVAPRDARYRLDSPSGLGAINYTLNKAAEKLGRIAWIAIDPISKIHALNENEQHNVAAVVRELDTLQQNFGNPGIIFVHHHGKMTQEKKELLHGGSLLRGSSHWHADADSIVTIGRVSPMEAHSPRFELRFETRHGEPLGVGRVQLLGGNMAAKWLGWAEDSGRQE